MRCDRFREAVSARLDGEPLGIPAGALDAHLAHCADCAAWADEAARATRLIRVRMVAVPDLSAAITAGVILPSARVMRRRLVVRIGLLEAGLAQFVIGILAVVGDSVGMSMSAHATHEAAAWNLAIGAAFLAAAAAPRRASGLVPLLATFMVVLTALSIHDVATGAVSAARLLTHVAALIGLVLVVVLDRLERALPPRWPGVGAPAEGPSENTGLRGVA